ncbi:MAG TPA: ABC transporter substrate-binding protein [Rhizomicrobium sp.]|nr:ABC transporter substrate-binding protein [Rhizomicrobium sp.]
MHRWKSILLGLVFALLPALAHAEPSPPVIRIGIAAEGLGGRQYAYRLSLDVVRAQGLLEKEFAKTGTKVTWTYFRGAGPAVSEALAGGQLDFVFHGDLPAVAARAAGLKTRYLMPLYARSNIYVAVPVKSPLKSLADLKGHVVANFRGTATQLVAERVLASANLTDRDLHFVNLDVAASNAALATSQIDAAFVMLNSFGLKDQNLIRYIFASNWQPRFSAVSGLIVTEDFARKYPQSVDRFVKAAVEGAYFAGLPQNRQAVFAIWAKSGYPQTYFERDYKGQDLKVGLSPLTDDFIVGKYKAAAADALRFGLIRKPVDLTGWFDRGPVERALVALHLEHFWVPADVDGKPKA